MNKGIKFFDYVEVLSCKQKKCMRKITIPLKLIKKGSVVIDIARCPQCLKSYRIVLLLAEKKQWLSIIGKTFFQCSYCGVMNDDNWEIRHGVDLWSVSKTVTRCKNCDRKFVKKLTEEIWTDLVIEFDKPLFIKKPVVEVEKVVPSISEPLIQEVATPTLVVEEEAKSKLYTPIEAEAEERAIPDYILEKSKHLSPELKVSAPLLKIKYTKYGQIILDDQQLCDESQKEHDKRFYQSLFSCKKCGIYPLVVHRITEDNLSHIKIQVKCPVCNKSINFLLNLLKIQTWISTLTASFFRCVKCESTCKIVKTQKKNGHIRITLYCEIDWMEIQKDIPIPFFQVLMRQTQKFD